MEELCISNLFKIINYYGHLCESDLQIFNTSMILQDLRIYY
jgi:hypothetical protein